MSDTSDENLAQEPAENTVVTEETVFEVNDRVSSGELGNGVITEIGETEEEYRFTVVFDNEPDQEYHLSASQLVIEVQTADQEPQPTEESKRAEAEELMDAIPASRVATGRTEVKTLTVPLSDVRRSTLLEALEDAIREERDLEEEKANSSAAFNARLKLVATRTAKILESLDSENEQAPVQCMWEADYATGKAFLVRPDNGEVIEWRYLDPEEQNLSLPFNEAADSTPEVETARVLPTESEIIYLLDRFRAVEPSPGMLPDEATVRTWDQEQYDGALYWVNAISRTPPVEGIEMPECVKQWNEAQSENSGEIESEGVVQEEAVSETEF